MSSKFLLLLLVAATLVACRTTPESPAPVEAAANEPAPTLQPAAPGYTLVWIRTGPKSGALTEDENRAAFAGHFANMERLAKERKLLLAGPFGEVRHADDLRGLFVLATADRAEAQAWAATDPTAQAGVFVLEHHTLATEMPLAALLEAELERLERRRAGGETPTPGEGVRGWALLIAVHGDLARQTFEPMLSPDGGVCFVGELEHGRVLVVLDAQNAAEARERFSPELVQIGAHTLDDWFATDLIATLVR